MRVRLLPYSRQLQQLIRAHGEEWKMVHRHKNILYFNTNEHFFIVSKDRKCGMWAEPDIVDFLDDIEVVRCSNGRRAIVVKEVKNEA